LSGGYIYHATSDTVICVKSGSNAFVTALDASKAFNCFIHTRPKLFDKLVVRGVPLCFLNVIRNWYETLVSVVRWNGIFSYEFRVLCGYMSTNAREFDSYT